MKQWKLKLRNLVADKNGDTWTADGLVLFPVDGWNFARATKARIGWWVDPDLRFITRNPESFRVLHLNERHNVVANG